MLALPAGAGAYSSYERVLAREVRSLISRRQAAAGAVLLAIITSLVTYALVVAKAQDYIGLPPAATGEFDKLTELLHLLEQKFVDFHEVDRTKLLEGAAAGLIRALGDPNSTYMTAREFEEFRLRTTGRYSGVGMTIGVRDRFITVIAPIKGTPAARAGIQPGDRILRVDGVDVYDRPSDEVALMIRGPEGTQVTLTLVRPPSTTPFEVTLTRANIVVAAAESRVLDGGIGYLQIISFNDHAAEETARELQSLLDQGIRALVLDLRNNGGGYLDQSLTVAGMFVPPGPVVSVVGRERNQTFQSHTEGLKLPLVVLVNAGTASASEIVAGAIQDRGSGLVVGTRTFGKASVQNLIVLDDGDALRVTTDYYYTPAGRSIHGTGIEPDVVVEVPEQESTPPLVFERELGEGTVHVQVLEVQRRLDRLGYRVEADGVLTAPTAAALREFQRQHLLPVTGRIDSDTVHALNAAIAALEEPRDVQLQRAVEILTAQIGG